ncbi:MAG TPA: hypothetical protein PK847_04500 [Candidatus Sumerlaeota bacterium]|nr:hypothetical protein [Candidatus Sumerlaeota bacterium]HOR28419.1 hypothetical protein [Candidatus Sumerlaeota bacterium]
MNVTLTDLDRMYDGEAGGAGQHELLKAQVFGAIRRHETKTRILKGASICSWIMFFGLAGMLSLNLVMQNQRSVELMSGSKPGGIHWLGEDKSAALQEPLGVIDLLAGWPGIVAAILLTAAICTTVIFLIRRRPTPRRLPI